MKKIFVNVYIGITIAVASFAFGLLLLVSMINTVNLDSLERCYYLSDYPLFHTVFFCIFFILVFAGYKTKIYLKVNEYLSDDRKYYKTIRVCLAFMALFSFLWNLSTQFSGFADSASIKNIVESMHFKDYSQFENDGYLGEYHNQAGLVLAEYIVSFVFGAQNHVAFAVCNCIFYIALGYDLFLILESMGLSRGMQFAVWTMEVLFLPTLLYTSFPYGTLGGLCFAIKALKYELKFIKGEGRIYKNLILVFLYCFLSIAIKQNFLIFSIAMILLPIVEGVDKRKIGFFFASLAVVLGMICALVIPLMTLKKISGYKLDQGRSSYNWIAMGLNYEDDGVIPDYAPGWWRYKYLESYTTAGFDKSEHERISKLEIVNEVNSYKEDPLKFFDFIILKNASMWSDPLFEGGFVLRKPFYLFPEWARFISSPLGINYLMKLLNPLQSLVFLGGWVTYFFEKNPLHF